MILAYMEGGRGLGPPKKDDVIFEWSRSCSSDFCHFVLMFYLQLLEYYSVEDVSRSQIVTLILEHMY